MARMAKEKSNNRAAKMSAAERDKLRDDAELTQQQAAYFLGIGRTTLAKLGTAVRFTRLSDRHITYTAGDLRAYERQCTTGGPVPVVSRLPDLTSLDEARPPSPPDCASTQMSDLQPSDELLAAALAGGLTYGQAANWAGVSEDTVSQRMEEPKFRGRVRVLTAQVVARAIELAARQQVEQQVERQDGRRRVR